MSCGAALWMEISGPQRTTQSHCMTEGSSDLLEGLVDKYVVLALSNGWSLYGCLRMQSSKYFIEELMTWSGPLDNVGSDPSRECQYWHYRKMMTGKSAARQRYALSSEAVVMAREMARNKRG